MLESLMKMLGMRTSPRPRPSRPIPPPDKFKDEPPASPGERVTFDLDGIDSLSGDGTFSFEVVGEINYQENIMTIAGPKESKGKSHSCMAVVQHQPGHPRDKNACAVFIDGYQVGHLNKDDAKDLVAVGGMGAIYKADAVVTGGWKRSRSEGMYGVRLDFLPRQFKATEIQKEMLRFFGIKASKDLTRGEAWDQEKLLEQDERYKEWNDFRLIVSYLQSEEGREDYCIRKPSMKAIRDAFTKLIAEGHSSAALASSMDEVVELMIDENPNMEKD